MKQSFRHSGIMLTDIIPALICRPTKEGTMNIRKIEDIAAVISHIEAHLNERLDLDAVANAAGYSKYHLHRLFTCTRLHTAQKADRGGKGIGIFGKADY